MRNAILCVLAVAVLVGVVGCRPKYRNRTTSSGQVTPAPTGERFIPPPPPPPPEIQKPQTCGFCYGGGRCHVCGGQGGRQCGVCNGVGRSGGERCWNCSASGRVNCSNCFGGGRCPSCNGSGTKW